MENDLKHSNENFAIEHFTNDLSYIHWVAKVQSYGGVWLTLSCANGLFVPICALVFPKFLPLAARHCD